MKWCWLVQVRASRAADAERTATNSAGRCGGLDRLVSDDIMNLVRRDADRVLSANARDTTVYRRKRLTRSCSGSAKRQTRGAAERWRSVYFGRGGEELETLCNAGIPFSVVRVLPQLLVALPIRVFHSRIGLCPERTLNYRTLKNRWRAGWENLAAEKQTLVFYMGLNQARLFSKS